MVSIESNPLNIANKFLERVKLEYEHDISLENDDEIELSEKLFIEFQN